MNRTITLSALVLVVFAVVVGILLQVLPGPHKPTDYMVIGAVATLLCILLLYFLLIKRDKRP
jgi:Na+/melibiose symporter-like transporter